jgi:hypothetical protein
MSNNPIMQLIMAVNGPEFSQELILTSGTNRVKEGMIWSAILIGLAAIIFYFAGTHVIAMAAYLVLCTFLMMNVEKMFIGIKMILSARKSLASDNHQE